MQKVTTQTATVWVDDVGVVHIESRGVASTAESVQATITAVEELLGGVRGPLLFDARRWPSSDTSGWVRFIALVESVCLAGAVLIDPESPADLGRYPAAVSRLLVPFAVFTDEAEALAFLQPYAEGSS